MSIIPTGKEVILGSGEILELVSFEVDIDGRKKMFERARRSPGVRAIIYDEASEKLLLSREYRREQGKYDYRLPGGKVIDTLEEFRAFHGDITEESRKAVIREIREETGIVLEQPEFYHVSKCGASIEWDSTTTSRLDIPIQMSMIEMMSEKLIGRLTGILWMRSDRR